MFVDNEHHTWILELDDQYSNKTQFDGSGHRIPRDPAGKHRKSLEHGSSIPTRNCSDFSRWIPVKLLYFPADPCRKSSEKIRKFSGRNTASTKSRELPGTGSFRTGLFDLGIFIIMQINFFFYFCCRNKINFFTKFFFIDCFF